MWLNFHQDIASVPNTKLAIEFRGVSELTSSSFWLAQKWTIEFHLNRNCHVDNIVCTNRLQSNLQHDVVVVRLTFKVAPPNLLKKMIVPGIRRSQKTNLAPTPNIKTLK
jgi:hypothetical protein